MGSSYDDWTVQQLKWTLKERGLPVSGNKRVLIERLEIEFPSSEGLEDGDLVYICQVCGEKFKSRNKLFDHLKEFPDHALEGSMAASKPTSEEKNYLEKGALDSEDAELVEQIRAKYRSPDYRPPDSKDEKYTKISYAMIALGLLAVAPIYFFLIEGNKQGDGFVLPFCTTSVLFIILASFIDTEVKKTDIVSMEEVGGAMIVAFTGILLFYAAAWALYTKSPGEWAGFYCCSCVILILTPGFALGFDKYIGGEGSQKLEEKKASRGKITREHRRTWEKAQKHEEQNQFDAATGIWSKLGEEEEVERVTRLKTECLGVVLKRRIKDLTEQGVDCTQLEEQLAMIETALAESEE